LRRKLQNIKIFKHDLVPVYDIPRIDIKGYRHYKVAKDKIYPSITTILSMQDKDFLQRWIDKVGLEESERIKKQSSDIGTALHAICEAYLKNAIDSYTSDMVVDGILFKQIKKYIDKIDTVKGIEIPLYSHELQIAGTCDCLGIIGGKLVVIDFKNSTKEKKRSWIDGYFLQGCFYALAYEEMYNYLPNEIIIIIADREGGGNQYKELTVNLELDTINTLKNLRSKFIEMIDKI
jgi:genome maintenance exonuclease 1